jgi:DNA-binding MarR family transcriptional regulator
MSDDLTSTFHQALLAAMGRLNQVAQSSYWKQWAPLRLSATHLKILQILVSHNTGISLAEVARELGVTPATTSDSVDTLVGKEFVSKQRSDRDGRALRLTLTDSGLQLVKGLAELPNPLSIAVKSLPPEEQERLYLLLFKMISALQAEGLMAPSRMCLRCRFFDPLRYPHSNEPYHCHQMNIPLGPRQLRFDCAVFEVAESVAQATPSEQFRHIADPAASSASSEEHSKEEADPDSSAS